MLFLEDSDLEGEHPPSGLPEIRVEAPSDMSLEESAMSGAPRGERPLDEDSRRQNSNMSIEPSNAEGTETTEGRSSRIKVQQTLQKGVHKPGRGSSLNFW